MVGIRVFWDDRRFVALWQCGGEAVEQRIRLRTLANSGRMAASEMISVRTDGTQVPSMSRYGAVCPLLIDYRSRFALL